MRTSKQTFIESKEAEQYFDSNQNKTNAELEEDETNAYWEFLHIKAKKIIDDIKKNNDFDASSIILSAILSILKNENF